MARFYESVFGLWDRLGRRGRIGLFAGFVLLLLGSSLAGLQQWNRIQHDNTFCTTCHLMRDPFQRFTQSQHAQLECHDCHRATVREEVNQLYQVVFNDPTEIRKHAHVPNATCARCHIEGDSTRWKIIANTAGHRRHLESRDPRLKDVQCVTCHGVSLHEFAPVDQTCGQAQCHAGQHIRLGAMGSVELHCTTCHNFLADARNLAVDSLGQPLTPAARQCFSCHAMQTRLHNLDIAHDPHRGTCGMCHNPHTQTTTEQISCVRSACHADWQTIGFHRGVPNPEQCKTCHQPHSWLVDGQNSTRCHPDIERQAPTRGGRTAGPPRAERLAPNAVAELASAGPVDLSVYLLQVQDTARPRLPRFSHGDHRQQACSSCHNSRLRHGALRVRTADDCARCHHSGPGRDQCATCHAATDLSQPVARLPKTFRLGVSGRDVSRTIAFPHARHTPTIACTICHSNTETRAPNTGLCSLCHGAHHRPDANCRTCHAAANPRASHRAAAHPNCAASGCHGTRAPDITTSRQPCLLCHADREQHMPGMVCSQCHRVTNPETRQ